MRICLLLWLRPRGPSLRSEMSTSVCCLEALENACFVAEVKRAQSEMSTWVCCCEVHRDVPAVESCWGQEGPDHVRQCGQEGQDTELRLRLKHACCTHKEVGIPFPRIPFLERLRLIATPSARTGENRMLLILLCASGLATPVCILLRYCIFAVLSKLRCWNKLFPYLE